MNIYFKRWITTCFCLSVLMCVETSYAAPVIAEQILLDNGGDSVAISGEWGFVGDTDECEVAVYKYDYSTNLWGDGAGTAGAKHSILDEGPCNRAAFRSFGFSISTTDGLLVVGAPEAKTGAPEHGKVFFYNYISGTDTWTLNPTVGSPEDPAGVPDFQDGALFGYVVSIRRAGNTALMLIGSPGYDVGGNADTGKVYLYTWNFTDSTLTFMDAVVGENAGDEFGTAVSSNGVEYVASAPKFDGGPPDNFTDQGKVYLSNVLAPSTALLTFTFGSGTAGVIDTSADNHNLGVSLSLTTDRILYMGGNTGPGAYAAQITDVVNPAASKLKNFPGTLGGDVSQSGSLAGLGYVGTKVEIYTDNTNPSVPTVTIDKIEPDWGRDISLSDARIMVNGNGAPSVNGLGLAYAYYTTSCYNGGTLKANEWAMIGLQCSTTADIGSIFTPDLDVYDTNWVMYKQNGTDYEGHQNAYVKMSAAEVMVQGQAYWIIADADVIWQIPDAIGDLATQTPTDADPLPNQGTRSEDVAGVYTVDLKAMLASKSTPTADIKVMFSNPFTETLNWSDTLFQDISTSFSLDVQATYFESSDISAYVYNPATGGYTAIVYATPGLPREIGAGEGFFTRFSNDFETAVLDNGAVTFFNLLLPQAK